MDICKFICILIFSIVCIMLMIGLAVKIEEFILTRKVRKDPEKYGIFPNNQLNILYEEGYPETFKVIIKDVDVDKELVYYIDENEDKTETTCTSIDNFCWLYILGHATRANRYDFPEGQD